jgi:predicted metal-dependent HD superfamily phosphohydrolase
METLLRAAWHECVGGSSAAVSVLDGLMSRYREPHRRYHGLAHLRHVVRDVGVLTPSVDLEVHPAVVRLAAFFHDAVYSPTAANNEAASAALARTNLVELGVDEVAIVEVERLVMTTVDHLADDPAAILLADADLAVLGADPAAYQAYVTACAPSIRMSPTTHGQSGDRRCSAASSIAQPSSERRPCKHANKEPEQTCEQNSAHLLKGRIPTAEGQAEIEPISRIVERGRTDCPSVWSQRSSAADAT